MNFIYTVFGWPLGWIMYVCYLIVENYGLALILFTIITKHCSFLWPSNSKSP